MKNYPIKDENGKEHWISRSMSVVMFVFCRNEDGKWCVLASERGNGTPDPEFVGSWNCQCGYLDYDETTKEAAQRETKEETGIFVPLERIKFLSFNDDPNDDKRQNVTFRYYAVLYGHKTSDFKFSKKEMEINEVGKIDWIPLDDLKSRRWAFGHDKLIKYAAFNAGVYYNFS